MNLLSILKCFLIAISFQSIDSLCPIKNNSVTYRNVTVLSFYHYDVLFSLSSVSLISNTTVNSSRSCFFKCENLLIRKFCKSYVFKSNESINNCFLYNRTFNTKTEIEKEDNSNLFFLVSNVITTTNMMPYMGFYYGK